MGKSDDLTVQAAAYLYGSSKFPQKEIAEVLGVSQPVVSRMLGRAREKGWLIQKVEFAEESFLPTQMKAIQQRAFTFDLEGPLKRLSRDRGWPSPRAVSVFHSGSKSLLPSQLKQRSATFGRAAAANVLKAILQSRIVGVAWGSTLASVIDGLEALKLVPPLTPQPVRFVATCGEPLGHDMSEVSSSFLARRLDKIVNGRSERYSSCLAGIAAVIPRKFIAKNEGETIQHFIESAKSYKKVFGARGSRGEHSLISQLDCFLTSVAADGRPWNMQKDEFIVTGGLDRDQLEALVCGDVGGVLIPRPDLTPRQQEELAEVRQMWTGIRRKDLERCAQSSRQGRPGVLVVTFGRNKKRVLYEATKMGLVNELIIDHDLADELAQESEIRKFVYCG
ncbi:MAG: hypothetical protein ACE5JX_06845 [Acidobacteriota bacterium]